MDALLQDLRYAMRMLAKNPGYTLVAVMALALGIGASAAIFSVVNAVLLSPLPYAQPDRLTMVWEHNRPRNRTRNVVSLANFQDWREQSSSFEDMAAFYDTRLNLTGDGEPEEIPGQLVTVNFFDVLGARPLIGRTFRAEDGQQGAGDVAILSHGLWQRRFGSDPNVLGRKVTIYGQSLEVVGVMPPGFQLVVRGSAVGRGAELWAPYVLTPNTRVRRGRAPMAVGRLKPGVTVEQAQSEMTAIAAALEQQYPDFNTGWGVNVVPLREQLVGEIRPALLILFGAVGFVLLIACANVANLLLARAASRQKEIAVRTALGAGRRRIVRQLLTESVLLALVGGGFGILLAYWGVDALLALAPAELPQLQAVNLNPRVLGFALAVSFATGILFGLAPALTAARANVNDALKEGGRQSSGGERGHYLRNAFVTAQVAIALVLLIGAGLLIRSFMRLQSVEPGFNVENLLTVRLALPATKYREDAQRMAFFQQLRERIESLPGVRSASAINFLPFAGPGAATSLGIEGRPMPPGGEAPIVESRVVCGGYFTTMGILLVAGRDFTDRELRERANVTIVNEELVRRHFPNENPIGKRIIIEMRDDNVPSEIIGVVRDMRYSDLTSEIRPMAYWPQPELVYGFMTLVIRTEGDPLSVAPGVRTAVAGMDPDQPISEMRTMEQWMGDTVARSRFSTMLLGLFAAIALLLASIGLYGVMSYTVVQRTHEIGIRTALGATAGDVLAMVVGHGMKLALAGVAVGLGAAFLLTRWLDSLLFEVSPNDPLTFAAISGVLVLVALLACLVPARRATRVDPMEALRYE